MKKIIIFSGTTEGRILSDKLTKESISHIVCVASDYGKEMMEENSFAQIKVGRMDAEGMTRFFEEQKLTEGDVVIDATHPFAVEVTSNIKKATDSFGVKLIRVIREEDKELPENAKKYSDITSCAKAIEETSGNILLTTGSKELSQYSMNVSDSTKQRTYVRVLPSADSLKICEKEAIESDHIIAMHGPFSTELNEALIRQYDIKHLVTKESGVTGGFFEKKQAAVNTGAQLYVIERPYTEEGISVDEAYKVITGKTASDTHDINVHDNRGMSIYLVGIGMGDEDSLTFAAKEAIKNSDIVFGAERLLRNITATNTYSVYLSKDIIPVLERDDPDNVTILFSGDTGFYSGAKKMLEALKSWRSDISVKVLPGISSISYLAAKLGESYDDACLFSIHGKNTEKDLKLLAEKVAYNDKVFVLLSGADDISAIAKKLTDMNIDARIFAGANLSYEEEIITELSLQEAMSYKANGVVTALIKNMQRRKRPLISVKKDSDFIRDKVPMTKECIRHESIIRLGLREGDIFYDIGGGTGSVAIEAATLASSLRVYTIEKKQEAVQLIKENIKQASVDNVEVLEGDAADILGDMARPDCVFIGGSGGKLNEIISLIHSKGEGIRFVINAVSLETIEEVRNVIKMFEPADEETLMMSVSEVQKIGSYHMLHGQNPIWITSFTL